MRLHVLYGMDSENIIQLSGPFGVTDSLGRAWQISGIRIYDEGYGIIDVYVDLATPMGDEPLHQDALVIQQIMSKLRALGYDGPDFGLGDEGLQDDKLIVLEAPEEFARFAVSRGWKNLAEEYADGYDNAANVDDILADPESYAAFSDLMRRLREN